MVPEVKVNVLIYKDNNEWIAHCLEMDLVAVNSSHDSVKNDIRDIIIVQINTAIENDNLENLYKSAPIEVWKRFNKVKSDICESQKLNLKSNPKAFHKQQIIPQLELCFAN